MTTKSYFRMSRQSRAWIRKLPGFDRPEARTVVRSVQSPDDPADFIHYLIHNNRPVASYDSFTRKAAVYVDTAMTKRRIPPFAELIAFGNPEIAQQIFVSLQVAIIEPFVPTLAASPCHMLAELTGSPEKWPQKMKIRMTEPVTARMDFLTALLSSAVSQTVPATVEWLSRMLTYVPYSGMEQAGVIAKSFSDFLSRHHLHLTERDFIETTTAIVRGLPKQAVFPKTRKADMLRVGRTQREYLLKWCLTAEPKLKATLTIIEQEQERLRQSRKPYERVPLSLDGLTRRKRAIFAPDGERIVLMAGSDEIMDWIYTTLEEAWHKREADRVTIADLV